MATTMDFQDIKDLEAARKAAATQNDEDVFDADEDTGPKEAKTAHHIRANSSIMHLKKLLGELRYYLSRFPRLWTYLSVIY